MSDAWVIFDRSGHSQLHHARRQKFIPAISLWQLVPDDWLADSKLDRLRDRVHGEGFTRNAVPHPGDGDGALERWEKP